MPDQPPVALQQHGLGQRALIADDAALRLRRVAVDQVGEERRADGAEHAQHQDREGQPAALGLIRRDLSLDSGRSGL
jgi:hypothetical protein